MNYKKIAVIAFVGALAIFSFYHLTTAGSDFTTLTTSDSGFFFGVGREINIQNGLIEEYELSHPPQGKEIAKYNQFQPLMLVTMYKGINAINSSVSLMDVSKYFGPFLFTLALLGAFLAGKELGDDIAGCTSALFFATLTGSIYWTKIGSFDREITLLFFGTWLFYLVTKVFKSEGTDFLKYSILAGLFYGMFVISWTGSLFMAAIVAAAIVLIILERAVSGLGLIFFAVIGLFPLGYKMGGFNGGMADVLAFLVLIGGLAKLTTDYEALEVVESKVVSSIKNNLRAISGILLLVGVSTIIAISLGGYGPDIWTSLFTDRIPQFLGIAQEGGGVSFPGFASEARSASPEVGSFLAEFNSRLYNHEMLTGIILAFTTIGLIKAVWSSKREGLLAFAWVLLIFPMPLAQSRFFRLFWPIIPIVAGYGLMVLFRASREMVLSPFTAASNWVDKLRSPIVIAIIGMVLIVPFVSNARDHATSENPSPHGGTLSSVYLSLMDSYEYIKQERPENVAPENFVVAVEWSHGHLLTGYANVASVTDGAQTVGWADSWREDSRIKPPDYLKFIKNGGHIYGLDYPARPYAINGRRVDIETNSGVNSMYYATSENELKWLLKTYRDNLDVELDYLVYNESPTRVMDLGGGRISRSVKALYSEYIAEINEVPKGNVENVQGENIQFSFDNEVITAQIERTRRGINVLGANDENGDNFKAVMIGVQARGRYQYVNHKFFPDAQRENALFVMYSQSGQSYQPTRASIHSFEGPPMIYRSYHSDTYDIHTW